MTSSTTSPGRWLQLVLLACLASCGYSSRAVGTDGGDLAVFVPLVTDPGLDVDAAGLMDTELRRAVARTSGWRLSSRDDAPATLKAELVNVRTGLAAFADPAQRAGQYVVTVRLKGRLSLRDAQPSTRTKTATGEAGFLSTGGRLEALDGAGRRALAQATRDAAEKLVWMLAAR